ncbi:MAG: hypothetical protein ACYC5O_08595 [Anaerolineae bacterium]
MEYLARVPAGVEHRGIEGRLTAALEADGLTVYRSFSLREALSTLPDCACQCHGTDQCTCTYTVMLAYDNSSLPALVIVHGRDGLLQVQVSGGEKITGAEGRIVAALSGVLEIHRLAPAETPVLVYAIAPGDGAAKQR